MEICLCFVMACAMTDGHTLPYVLQVKERAGEGQQCLSHVRVISITPGRGLADLRSNQLDDAGSSAGEDAARSISTTSE